MTTDEQAMALYMAYPRKVARKVGLIAIKNALSEESFDVLMDAVQEFSRAREGQESQYTPHPATWFNAERWTDDRADWWVGRRPDVPAETAWEKVREAISRFGTRDPAGARGSLDGPTASTVKALGWQNLCSMTDFNRDRLFQQFKTQYEKEAINATRNAQAVTGRDREGQHGVREAGKAEPGDGPRAEVRGALRKILRDRDRE
jgi:hypothetical protein